MNSVGEGADFIAGGSEAAGADGPAVPATAGASAAFPLPSRRNPPKAASVAAPVPNGMMAHQTRKPRSGMVYSRQKISAPIRNATSGS